jgi:hypothetical protein
LASGKIVGIFLEEVPTHSEKVPTPLRRLRMALTDAKLRAIKPQSADFKIADGEGLYLLVTTTGAKRWRLAYRFAGKQKALALGVYPKVSLL